MEIYSAAILRGPEEARSSYLERRCWCWMALSRLYGGTNEGVAPVRQYIAYVLCKTDAVWGKTCTTAMQRRTRWPLPAALKCFSVTFPGSGSGSFVLRYPVPNFPHRLPPPFYCHLPLCENRRAPVDFTLNPRSRAQSAEDRTARQHWQPQTEIAPLINSWKKVAALKS